MRENIKLGFWEMDLLFIVSIIITFGVLVYIGGVMWIENEKIVEEEKEEEWSKINKKYILISHQIELCGNGCFSKVYTDIWMRNNISEKEYFLCLNKCDNKTEELLKEVSLKHDRWTKKYVK